MRTKGRGQRPSSWQRKPLLAPRLSLTLRHRQFDWAETPCSDDRFVWDREGQTGGDYSAGLFLSPEIGAGIAAEGAGTVGESDRFRWSTSGMTIPRYSFASNGFARIRCISSYAVLPCSSSMSTSSVRPAASSKMQR